jgi:hypothetical protein
MQYDLVIKRT